MTTPAVDTTSSTTTVIKKPMDLIRLSLDEQVLVKVIL